MPKPKEKQEPETPCVCVCGRTPCTVKHKTKHMLACPDLMACAMRSRWASTEQAAIVDWNTTVKSAKQEASRARYKTV